MIEHLAQRLADNARSAAGASESLVPFQVSALGNFPYYWQDPSTLRFNALTYGWINASLKPAACPVELDNATFTTYYIRALGSVAYSLSTADEAALSAAQRQATEQQTLVLQAWRTAFGALPVPPPPLMPIDTILDIVATEWADPPTDLLAMQAAKDLKTLLNCAPPHGEPVVNAVANYLAVLGAVVPLLNATPMNNGRVQTALRNVQNPTLAGGGLLTNDGALRPAYRVLTPLADILSGLGDPTKAMSLELSIERGSETAVNVFGDTIEPFVAALDELIAITPAGSDISLLEQCSRVVVRFEGFTRVRYGPTPYDIEKGTSWFWMQPIVEAIANGKRDVSGFHFSPRPLIDFSACGPFGFLTEVLISRLPSFALEVPTPPAAALAETWNVSFLGIDLSRYTVSSQRSLTANSATVTLAPMIEDNVLDSRAWVHLAAPDFPAAQ